MYKRILAAVLLLAMCFLSACGKTAVSAGTSEAVAPADTPAPTTTAAAPETTAVSSYPLTLIDQAGREVTIEKKPERIVSGYYISTSAFMALGLRENLVGIEAKADKRAIYKLSAPELIDLPNVGSVKEFDLEGCLALQPDLVVLPVKLKDAAATISELGIPVLLVNPESEVLSSEMINLIAKACGVEDQAAALNTDVAKIKSRLSSLTGEAPTVYMAGNSDFLKTAGGNMYQSEMIKAAGCVNVAEGLSDSNWATVSYEQVVTWNPDVILLAAEASYTVEDVLNDPALSQVNAVKNGKVFAMPSDLEAWDAPVPGAVLGSLFLAKNTRGGLSEEEYEGSVKEFYGKYYGIK